MNEITTTQTPRPGAYAPWLGIGATGSWSDYHDALAAAEMDFTVQRDPAYWMRPDGAGIYTPETLPNCWVNYRTDTNQIMGLVSDQYGIVQNEEAFALIQPFADAGGVITNAGYTEQGLQFMVLRMKSVQFLGDNYDLDVMCTNSFNGKFPLGLMMSPIRIFCQNMYKSLRRKDSILVLYHGNRIQERIIAATAATSIVDDWAKDFGKALEDAANIHKSEKEIDTLIALLFPYGKEGTPREMESKQRVDEIREQFKQTYYLAPDNSTYTGTALGFLNAYYDYLSHGQLGKRYRNFQERRLSGIVSGNAVNTQAIRRAFDE